MKNVTHLRYTSWTKATITTPEPASSCGRLASCNHKINRFARETIKATLIIGIESNSLIKRIQTIRKYIHIPPEIHKVKNPISLTQKLKMTLLITIKEYLLFWTVFNYRSQTLKCFLPLKIWIILIFWNSLDYSLQTRSCSTSHQSSADSGSWSWQKFQIKPFFWSISLTQWLSSSASQ